MFAEVSVYCRGTMRKHVCVYTGAARVFVVGRMGERANCISIFCTVTLAPVPVQRGPKV